MHFKRLNLNCSCLVVANVTLFKDAMYRIFSNCKHYIHTLLDGEVHKVTKYLACTNLYVTFLTV